MSTIFNNRRISVYTATVRTSIRAIRISSEEKQAFFFLKYTTSTLFAHFTFLSLICRTTSCILVIGFHLLLNSLDAFNIRDEALFVYTKIGLWIFSINPINYRIVFLLSKSKIERNRKTFIDYKD